MKKMGSRGRKICGNSLTKLIQSGRLNFPRSPGKKAVWKKQSTLKQAWTSDKASVLNSITAPSWKSLSTKNNRTPWALLKSLGAIPRSKSKRAVRWPRVCGFRRETQEGCTDRGEGGPLIGVWCCPTLSRREGNRMTCYRPTLAWPTSKIW